MDKRQYKLHLFHRIRLVRASFVIERRLGPLGGMFRLLVISFHPTGRELLKKREQRALEEYTKKFAELPPMNCQMPGYGERV